MLISGITRSPLSGGRGPAWAVPLVTRIDAADGHQPQDRDFRQRGRVIIRDE
jgi:hypothetical protein